VALTKDRKDKCTVFVGKRQIWRPFGKPRRRLGYIIMDLKEIRLEGGGGGAWIGSIYFRIGTRDGPL
jgi:hypothetical protein